MIALMSGASREQPAQVGVVETDDGAANCVEHAFDGVPYCVPFILQGLKGPAKRLSKPLPRRIPHPKNHAADHFPRRLDGIPDGIPIQCKSDEAGHKGHDSDDD